jgi:hypothetical protein
MKMPNSTENQILTLIAASLKAILGEGDKISRADYRKLTNPEAPAIVRDGKSASLPRPVYKRIERFAKSGHNIAAEILELAKRTSALPKADASVA